MGETHASGVFGEPWRCLAVGEWSIVFFGNAHPRSQVDLVNCVRCAQRIARGTLFHPLAIAPLIVEVPNYGRSTRRLLVQQADGVGFVDTVAMPLRFDVKLVQRSLGYAWDKTLPDTGRAS